MRNLREIIHSAMEKPKRDTYFYLFFLDPRSDKPVTMERLKFTSSPGTPATMKWVDGSIQRLPLFWIYEKDFLEAIEYSDWARDFEDESAFNAAFVFPDYKECRKKGVGKYVSEE